MKCDTCKFKRECDDHKGIRRICSRNGYDSYEPITNYDLLISKTPKEIAEWLADILDHCENKKPEELCRMSCPLYKCCNDQPSDNIEYWLKSPVEEEK